MLVAMAAIAYYSYHNNRRDALALSDEVLAALEQRIATQVKTFLEPAARLVALAKDTLGQYHTRRIARAYRAALGLVDFAALSTTGDF